MKILDNNLLQEFKEQVSLSKGFSGIEPNQGKNNLSSDFGKILSNAINAIDKLQDKSSDLSTRFDMGDSTVSLSDTVVAREKASVAFSAAIEVRNKFVEAYQSVINMPVWFDIVCP